MKVVVVACDAYADIAPAFRYFFLKAWPGWRGQVEYVTNSKDLGLGSKSPVHYIPGKEIDFGSRFRTYVEKHFREPDGLMLLMMIDYLPVSVNLHLIARAAALCRRDDIRHVRLVPMPHPQGVFSENPEFGVIDKCTRYCLSLQPGIWSAKLLYDLCKRNESPYHTETFGSARVCRANLPCTFLCTRKSAIIHHNYYKKGTAQEWAVSWVMENSPEAVWPDAARRRAKK